MVVLRAPVFFVAVRPMLRVPVVAVRLVFLAAVCLVVAAKIGPVIFHLLASFFVRLLRCCPLKNYRQCRFEWSVKKSYPADSMM